ncbi:phosphatidylglycerophosphatase A [Geomonas sp. RF6]|uniref:phosphatidylglycerophosphatase A family protein n=1 Tax=Geomonas sp. RF6 TaxID=2897342 RepID=UPI001E2A06A9|nr:phosphatidylglycerophosphatase A [Geomonas sp. RF6]UFS71831.1 phosphatidylglycerophosphatase A [Geomonas sp. RF6]
MRLFLTIAATWGGLGYFPVASGTVGTLGAIPLYLALSRLSLPLYLVTVVAFTLLACRVSGDAETIFGEKDSGKIVIDEVAGFLVTMTGVAQAFPEPRQAVPALIAGFLFFRLFDIVKPPPARFFDQKLKNGYGVVLDDIAAGVYACAATHLVLRLL